MNEKDTSPALLGERVPVEPQLLAELGLQRVATIASVQRGLHVGVANAMRLLAVAEEYRALMLGNRLEESTRQMLIAAVKLRQWDKTWCGGCGVTYYRCGGCSVGVEVGRETHHGDCGGHRKTPCAETCLIAMAHSVLAALSVSDPLVPTQKETQP